MGGKKSIFVTGLAEVSTTEKETLGDLRWEGNKCYKYVQYKATAIACIANSMVGYYSEDGYKNHQVTLDTSDQEAAGTLLAAGVTQAVIPTNGYGWIQIKGLATLAAAMVAGADGQPLSLVGATADLGDVDLAAGALDHQCGWAGDISDKEMIVDCPF
jgi:hypothetical protein